VPVSEGGRPPPTVTASNSPADTSPDSSPASPQDPPAEARPDPALDPVGDPPRARPADARTRLTLNAPGGGGGGEAAPSAGSPALRGLACARAFSVRTDTVGCPQSGGLDFSRYASGEAVAQVDAATQGRFNALFGLYGAALDPTLRRLPGQQGMQVMTNRRAGLSGADEMRDTLPPMVPDPAFGD
jgi:hypothetical protein